MRLKLLYLLYYDILKEELLFDAFIYNVLCIRHLRLENSAITISKHRDGENISYPYVNHNSGFYNCSCILRVWNCNIHSKGLDLTTHMLLNI